MERRDQAGRIKRARLDGPLAQDAVAKIVFRTGLRLRFRVVGAALVPGLGTGGSGTLLDAQRAIVEWSESEHRRS